MDPYQRAITLYSGLVALHPDDPRPRMALKAAVVAKLAGHGDVLNLENRGVEAEFRAAKASYRKNPPQLILLHQQYLLFDPTHSTVRSDMANLLLKQGHAVGALTEAEMALKDDPKNQKAARIVVRALTKLGRKEEARRIRLPSSKRP